MNILITGAEGFIGSNLADRLKDKKHKLYLCVSKRSSFENLKNVFVVCKGRLEDNDLNILTKNIDVIVHCAGLAHNINSFKNYSTYFSVNCLLTVKLANSAIKNKVKKFIFLSTAGIHSDFISNGITITEGTHVNPRSAYTKSKHIAEESLVNISKDTNMDLVILRPPAVYGKGVKGNLKILSFFIDNKIPLPFKSFDINKRSYISITNLIDLISLIIDYRKKVSGVFLVANRESLSTMELINYIASDYGKKPILFKFPILLLKLFSVMMGKIELTRRLLNSFELDTSAVRKQFEWNPRK